MHYVLLKKHKKNLYPEGVIQVFNVNVKAISLPIGNDNDYTDLVFIFCHITILRNYSISPKNSFHT